MFLAIALQCFFIPDNVLDLFSISYEGSAGLSTLRGDLGGLFFSMSVFLLMGLRAHQRHWIMAANMMILFIMLGRVIGMVMDEFTQHLFTVTAIELVIVFILYVAYIFLKESDKSPA